MPKEREFSSKGAGRGAGKTAPLRAFPPRKDDKRLTRRIPVGDKFIGGGGRVLVQSMTNTPTADVEATVAQINALTAAGCDVVRIAVTDAADAAAARKIAEAVSQPVVADIQYDYKLALLALENGVHKVRVNPGNIGGAAKFRAVCDAARGCGAAIRIGVNGGSLERDILARFGGASPAALAESALRWARVAESFKFYDLVLSVKSSSVKDTIEANRILSARADYPLHIGVTEAGGVRAGTLKSAVGIGGLLADGIGDTVRVSLTGDPVREVEAARGILRAVGIDKAYAEVISCPTCARCKIDLAALVEEVEAMTAGVEKPLKLAVMGCMVNGPGEGRGADLGIAGGPEKSVIFKKGEILRTVNNAELLAEFIKEVAELL